MTEQIEEYRNNLIKIDELVYIINPAIEKIDLLMRKFKRYWCTYLKNDSRYDRNKELSEYGAIKSELLESESELFNNIELANSCNKMIQETISALEYCLRNDKTFDELMKQVSEKSVDDRVKAFDYNYVVGRFVKIKTNLKNLQQKIHISELAHRKNSIGMLAEYKSSLVLVE